jgi:nitrate/nitrite transport system substrate-binding protein
MNTRPTQSAPTTSVSRRRFLSNTAKGLGAAALLNGLPKGWVGSVYASDAPETSKMQFGIIALTDCDP